MPWTRILAALLFIDFAALNIYAVATSGLDGLVAFVDGLNAWGVVAVADLALALGVAVFWMWRDARSHDRSAAPYALLTATTGSLGPLLYLFRRAPR